MDTYSVFREIADSWGLLGMMLFFLTAVFMLFRPGAKQQHLDASQIPFRDEPSKNSNREHAGSELDQKLEG